MLDFQKIIPEDKLWMQPLLEMSNFRSEEYSFTFTYIWRSVFGYTAARMNDYLIIKSTREGYPPSYLFPAGSGDITPVLEAIRTDAKTHGHDLIFHTVLAPSVSTLENLYPGRFTFTPLTDYYVYSAQSLISLKGKKLHAKRNHINRFRADHSDWQYEPITPENLPEVADMSEDWCLRNGCRDDKSLREESRSVRAAIREMDILGLDGGLIRANGKVVAFSLGDRLNSDTYLIHIEKAYSDIQGAYAMINQEFAAHNCANYLYINREDDSGDEGLRKAKQSYRPAFQIEKFSAHWQGESL